MVFSPFESTRLIHGTQTKSDLVVTSGGEDILSRERGRGRLASPTSRVSMSGDIFDGHKRAGALPAFKGAAEHSARHRIALHNQGLSASQYPRWYVGETRLRALRAWGDRTYFFIHSFIHVFVQYLFSACCSSMLVSS